MKQEDAQESVRQARKALPIFAPMAVLLLVGTWFQFLPELAATARDLLNRAPAIRIGWADPLALIVFPLLLLVLVALVLKALPAAPAAVRLLVRAIHGLLIAGVVVLFVVLPAGRYIQGVYMPQAGYFRCDELKGHPTIWFNDWLRDPAWCVSGKDRPWVLEQAEKTKGRSSGN